MLLQAKHIDVFNGILGEYLENTYSLCSGTAIRSKSKLNFIHNEKVFDLQHHTSEPGTLGRVQIMTLCVFEEGSDKAL